MKRASCPLHWWRRVQRTAMMVVFTTAIAPAVIHAGDTADSSTTNREAMIEHGSYLVHRVAMCVQCHSARDASGALTEHNLLRGAPMPLNSPFNYQVWAFVAPPIYGLPSGYTEDDMVKLLTQGVRRDGAPPNRPMPPYSMSEYDARSIAAYLKWTSTEPEARDISREQATRNERALATLAPVKGSKVSGVVEFISEQGAMHIIADVRGLTSGLHGFSILETRECGSEIPGDHFNPGGTAHGAPGGDVQHVGDLGNIIADENGNARYERFDNVMSFNGSSSIVGHAVVVSTGYDDLTTDPDGAAGAPLACGVIHRLSK